MLTSILLGSALVIFTILLCDNLACGHEGTRRCIEYHIHKLETELSREEERNSVRSKIVPGFYAEVLNYVVKWG